ncbi:MAG TPA: hypothetical protein VFZ09_22095 [Archangium sp.]|uniref:hypothetical protein n=1 Tax=Archangium sp. TaxID=1872627 RepID=UPI002E360F71|nr:hypothetical protein [Archangium sp.]HEX5748948.1 hypothetical protein [Archangium sp.]
MLRITKEQLQVFRRLSRQSFVEEMLGHLHQFTPVHARSLRPKTLRSIIELGIQRANGHGWTQRGPVRLYIEVMFTLGSDFDSDPQFPWAATILGQELADELQGIRAHELYRATSTFLDAAAGPDGQYTLDALRRARAVGLKPAIGPFAEWDRWMLEELQVLGPEKSRYVGEQDLRDLLRHARAQARAHGAQTLVDEALIALLMFGLGHGCLTDPQFPWIAATLSARKASGGFGRFERLRGVAMHYLGRMIENLSRSRGSQSVLERRGARS